MSTRNLPETVISNESDIKAHLGWLRGYAHPQFLTKMAQMLAHGDIAVVFVKDNSTMWIDLKNCSMAVVVNNIIGLSNADEISIEGEDGLRLWWD